MDHSINISTIAWDFFIDTFSSTNFSILHQSCPFPAAIRADYLQLTDRYYDFLDSIDRVVDYIRQHGSFTVVSLCERDLINDQEIIYGITNTQTLVRIHKLKLVQFITI